MVYITPPDMNDSFSRIVLEGTEYLIRFTYNDTFDYWTFGLYEDEDTPIIAGIKIVPCFPLNQYYRTEKMPDGIFGVLTEQETVGRNAFVEGKAQFVFIPTGELPEEVRNV